MIRCSSTASGPIVSSEASICSRRGTGARDVICGPRQQHLPPVPQRRETGRDRAERGESIKLRLGFRSASELQERQRLLQMPVARGAQITAAGQRRCFTKHCQRVAGASSCKKSAARLSRARMLFGSLVMVACNNCSAASDSPLMRIKAARFEDAVEWFGANLSAWRIALLASSVAP